MRVWKEKKEQAQQEGRRTALPKPKREKLEKANPKPTVRNEKVDGHGRGRSCGRNEADSGGSEDEAMSDDYLHLFTH
ncbi:hypothetical protein JVT61DRAFT_14104 [Boletus reticuloceps]|uniref:Uncharacterized protein n=1 Tax=Boletus reticuloceps TaxID=495285 RepID=A0A8I2YCY8_9AGAM|nr:hypothetical protein JVT61DRAFT_14104 [Boletus reticuloceps]